MRAFVAFMILLLSSCATGPSPESYDYPFKGKVYTHYLNSTDLDAFCGGNARACSLSYDIGQPTAVCMMYIDNQYARSKPWLACIKKHENRHCNGYYGEANAC